MRMGASVLDEYLRSRFDVAKTVGSYVLMLRKGT